MKKTEKKKALKEARKEVAGLYARPYKLFKMRSFKVLEWTKEFYEEAADFLEANNFERYGDYRVTSMPRNSPSYRTPLRIYISADGLTVATAYFLQVPVHVYVENVISGMASPLILDLNTEFTDGSFLETSNAEAASIVEQPKEIQSVRLEADTPLKAILKRHKQELAKNKKAGRQPLKINSEQDMIASANRMGETKRKFRNKVGIVQLKEVEAVEKRLLDEGLVDFSSILNLLFTDEIPKRKKRRK